MSKHFSTNNAVMRERARQYAFSVREAKREQEVAKANAALARLKQRLDVKAGR